NAFRMSGQSGGPPRSAHIRARARIGYNTSDTRRWRMRDRARSGIEISSDRSAGNGSDSGNRRAGEGGGGRWEGALAWRRALDAGAGEFALGGDLYGGEGRPARAFANRAERTALHARHPYPRAAADPRLAADSAGSANAADAGAAHASRLDSQQDVGVRRPVADDGLGYRAVDLDRVALHGAALLDRTARAGAVGGRALAGDRSAGGIPDRRAGLYADVGGTWGRATRSGRPFDRALAARRGLLQRTRQIHGGECAAAVVHRGDPRGKSGVLGAGGGGQRASQRLAAAPARRP